MFGRTSRSTHDVVEPSAAPAREGGKGRPTPKRREAERGRRRAAAAPRDRKEAYRRTRDQQREQRARMMHGLKAGDEKLLPARDRGPVRRFARDLVDSRRSVAEFFLPLALIILILNFTSSPRIQLVGSALWMLLVVLIVVDSVVLSTQLKKRLRRIHPDEGAKGVVPYALMRSMQIRRFRLPPPRMKSRRRR
ncbi:MAG: DUF3043 domain-containing protein [Sporichthyaceae bacterium]